MFGDKGKNGPQWKRLRYRPNGLISGPANTKDVGKGITRKYSPGETLGGLGGTT